MQNERKTYYVIYGSVKAPTGKGGARFDIGDELPNDIFSPDHIDQLVRDGVAGLTPPSNLTRTKAGPLATSRGEAAPPLPSAEVIDKAKDTSDPLHSDEGASDVHNSISELRKYQAENGRKEKEAEKVQATDGDLPEVSEEDEEEVRMTQDEFMAFLAENDFQFDGEPNIVQAAEDLGVTLI